MIGILVVVGAGLAVFITSLFKTVNMDTRVKTLVSLVVSTALALLVALIANGGNFNGFESQSPVLLIGTLYGTQQAIYNFLLKDTALDAKLEDTLITSDVPNENIEGN